MILPIVPYGNNILRTLSAKVDNTYPNLNKLIDDMFHTMVKAYGIGISAVQVNLPINLFIINYDLATKKTEDPSLKDTKKVFINSKILETKGTNTSHREGCLSIPTIFEDVIRQSCIKMEYLDENFVLHTEEFTGLIARVVQHEYDHTIGKLFIDYLNDDRIKSINKKLDLIKSGKIQGHYPMKY
ncbi:MAG: peptide deformylase [Solitalea-like symbiont of Tyrophagus putrescentiae]